jgi:hypothetical protein
VGKSPLDFQAPTSIAVTRCPCWFPLGATISLVLRNSGCLTMQGRPTSTFTTPAATASRAEQPRRINLDKLKEGDDWRQKAQKALKVRPVLILIRALRTTKVLG